MKTIVTLYKYDRHMCSCQEQEIKILYDSMRKMPPQDLSITGQIRQWWKGVVS
jgi:hypothetical protein